MYCMDFNEHERVANTAIQYISDTYPWCVSSQGMIYARHLPQCLDVQGKERQSDRKEGKKKKETSSLIKPWENYRQEFKRRSQKRLLASILFCQFLISHHCGSGIAIAAFATFYLFIYASILKTVPFRKPNSFEC